MKHLNKFSLKTFTSISFLAVLLLLFVSSCDPTKRATKNHRTHLDPVVGKNTNPKDTSNTGPYTPVTDLGKNPDGSPKKDTITWCDTLQESEFKRIVVCFKKVGNNTIKADTINIIEINSNAIYSSTAIDSTINQKLAYKVVVMMPFMSNNFTPTPRKEIPSQSIKATEFYEGVLIALDSLKAEGVSLFVNVFDSQRDTAVVQALLNKRELQEADLIVGPISSKTLKLVAKFAKENKKPLISPFNSRTDLTTDNPYYIQVNPSFQVHSDYIIKELHKIERDKNVIRTPMEKNLLLLGMSPDSLRITALQKSYSAYKNDSSAKITQIIRSSATIDIGDIKGKLDKTKLNIIVIPSYKNEGFVYNSLREIQKLVDKVEPRKGYQIVIIGMDRWKYYSRINFEYFESMNLYLSSQFFTDLSKDDVKKFRNDYKAIYGIASREFGFIGFDVMLYFGRMIDKYGVNFQAHLWKEPSQYGHTSFQIEPSYEILAPLDGSIDQTKKTVMRGYENKYLNFLKFENYKLKKVN